MKVRIKRRISPKSAFLKCVSNGRVSIEKDGSICLMTEIPEGGGWVYWIGFSGYMVVGPYAQKFDKFACGDDDVYISGGLLKNVDGWGLL